SRMIVPAGDLSSMAREFGGVGGASLCHGEGDVAGWSGSYSGTRDREGTALGKAAATVRPSSHTAQRPPGQLGRRAATTHVRGGAADAPRSGKRPVASVRTRRPPIASVTSARGSPASVST